MCAFKNRVEILHFRLRWQIYYRGALIRLATVFKNKPPPQSWAMYRTGGGGFFWHNTISTQNYTHQPILYNGKNRHDHNHQPCCYMRGVATHTHKRDDHYPVCSKLHYGCLLSFCGPTACMYVATLWPYS